MLGMAIATGAEPLRIGPRFVLVPGSATAAEGVDEAGEGADEAGEGADEAGEGADEAGEGSAEVFMPAAG